MTVTILGILEELKVYTPVSEESLQKAKDSNIDSLNNTNFKSLISGWKNGWYDEDPDLLVSEIETLL